MWNLCWNHSPRHTQVIHLWLFDCDDSQCLFPYVKINNKFTRSRLWIWIKEPNDLPTKSLEQLQSQCQKIHRSLKPFTSDKFWHARRISLLTLRKIKHGCAARKIRSSPSSFRGCLRASGFDNERSYEVYGVIRKFSWLVSSAIVAVWCIRCCRKVYISQPEKIKNKVF